MLAGGAHVAIHAAALPTDRVTGSATPTATAQGTARPEEARSAVKVTGGPCAPWGTKTLAGDGVAGCPHLTVTVLTATLSEGAWFTPLLTELAVEASRADTLTADRVAGRSMLTLTRCPAASPMEAGGTGMLAGLAVEARAAAAGTRGGLTCAVVLARALQTAGGTVVTRRAGLLAVWPCPA